MNLVSGEDHTRIRTRSTKLYDMCSVYVCNGPTKHARNKIRTITSNCSQAIKQYEQNIVLPESNINKEISTFLIMFIFLLKVG